MSERVSDPAPNSALLPCIEVETGANPRASVIWLHGLGADGHDFEPIVGELAPFSQPLRFVFPHAPVRPVTINGGMAMRAWYDIVSTELDRREDAAGVVESQTRVEALIRHENARGVPDESIVLAGFSQGGAIALHCMLRRTRPLAGVMALSTYLPMASRAQAEATPVGRAMPVFYGHGLSDGVLSLPRAIASRDVLVQLGCPVQWHTYPMAHSVCAAEVRDIADWLRTVLPIRSGAH